MNATGFLPESIVIHALLVLTPLVLTCVLANEDIPEMELFAKI
mgnify:FL=1